MKRLGIFCFNEKDGIVDKYIEFLLDDIILNLEKLYIVCNGTVNDVGMQTLYKYTDKIYVRENKGFDGGAYKDMILNHISNAELKEYDELLLFNNSFFGPLYPFKLVFDKMQTSKGDFWGLLNQGTNILSHLAISDHIQSYFIVVRKNMLLSNHFKSFWNGLNDLELFEDAIIDFENKFTDFFVKLGFKRDVFVDIIAYEKEHGFSTMNWSVLKSLDLIQNFNFPIIKKTAFIYNRMFNLNSTDLITFLTKHTRYDVNCIWDYLIRTQNVQIIYNGLSQHYILPTKLKVKQNDIKSKVAVFIHLYYENLVKECFNYIVEFPDWVDVYITTSNSTTHKIIQELSDSIQNIKKISLTPNKGRDIASLLIYHKKDILTYDYFCFTHDKKSTKNSPAIMGDLFRLTLWENSIKNDCFITNLLSVFRDNPKIGLLVPPYPRYSVASIGSEDWWGNNFKNTIKLAELLNIDIANISKSHQPLSIGTSFWAKTEALKKLLDYPFVLEDFIDEPLPSDGTMSHAVERVLPFVAQNAGYATGVLESTDFASRRMSFFEQVVANSTHTRYLRDYVVLHEKCYIYGCGKIATTVTNMLLNESSKIIGYVVTDSKNNPSEFLGKPVYSIDDINIDRQTGLILALGVYHTRNVIDKIKKMGITDCFLFSDIS